jgi:hypothetical protein
MSIANAARSHNWTLLASEAVSLRIRTLSCTHTFIGEEAETTSRAFNGTMLNEPQDE